MLEVRHSKPKNSKIFLEVQNWLYRNGRQLEVALWKYYFCKGTKEEIIAALMEYQNTDGGFGHALEADNWNPESSPITTNYAIDILNRIEFFDMTHPIYKGIWKYLHSEQDLLEYGWRFTIPGNDHYPHAPWWNYSEEQNEKEYYGVTASLCAFIIRFGKRETAIYKKAIYLTDHLIKSLLKEESYGDMGLAGYISLLYSIKEDSSFHYDTKMLMQVLSQKIANAIEQDTTKWAFYGVRPSNYIQSPDNPFYEENKEIVQKELAYLIQTKPVDDVWGITWTWFENMEKYEKYFTLSENWWKGARAVDAVCMLHNFGIIE